MRPTIDRRAAADERNLDTLFMVIERFKNRDAKAVYRRFRDQGRQLPDGLSYVDS